MTAIDNAIDHAVAPLVGAIDSLDGRIRRLEAAAGAPDVTDAWHEQMEQLRSNYQACVETLEMRSQQLARSAQDLNACRKAKAGVEQRLSEALQRRQAMDRFWEMITNSLADSTSRLAARFGNDNTWDELIEIAADRLDELDPRP